MPAGTRVHICVDKVKEKAGVNPYAVCQASTKQSYATGKPLADGGLVSGKDLPQRAHDRFKRACHGR